MSEGQKSDSVSRREFLGYCIASAALITNTASGWATEFGADDGVTRSLHGLNESLDGDLLLPDHQRFEAMRGLSWNSMIPERRPDLIVMAKTKRDVVSALQFAREQQRQVAVRGGGHNWCASALRDDGVLLDLSQMRSLSIDAESGTAVIEPAVRGMELIDAAAEHDLMFPVAHCPTVTLSGFLLNGGNGLNYNRLGNAASNILSIDLVLADGRELTVSKEKHPDLFWAARGAGPGFFAVATRYHLKLHPLPKSVTMSSYVFPGAATATASDLVERLSAKMSPDVCLVMSIGAPPTELAGSNNTVAVVSAFAYADSAADAEAILKPLNADPSVGEAISNVVNAPTDLQSILGAVGVTLPGGHRTLVDNIWSNAPLGTMLADTPAHYANAPSSKSHVTAMCLHLPSNSDETSYRWLGRYLVYNNTVWTEEADDEANRTWHSTATSLLDPHKVGRYVGETDLTKEADVAQQCYTPETWTRLRKLRAAYDPNGLFHDYLQMT